MIKYNTLILLVITFITSIYFIVFVINYKNNNDKYNILFWDNDGTIVKSRNPNDNSNSRTIFPGISLKMEKAEFNCIISGFKSPESESRNFDPEKIIDQFTQLMKKLPITAVAFSPKIGGVACYIIIKKGEKIIIKKAHQDPRYAHLIGRFKKPDIGMFVVMQDILLNEFGININKENTAMIGDTWHDKAASEKFGIKFIEAKTIHNTYSQN